VIVTVHKEGDRDELVPPRVTCPRTWLQIRHFQMMVYSIGRLSDLNQVRVVFKYVSIDVHGEELGSSFVELPRKDY
jgi:hypothetical protein